MGHANLVLLSLSNTFWPFSVSKHCKKAETYCEFQVPLFKNLAYVQVFYAKLGAGATPREAKPTLGNACEDSHGLGLFVDSKWDARLLTRQLPG